MEILNKIIRLNNKINCDYQKLEELDNKAIGVSSVIYGDKVQSSNIYSFNDILVKKFDLQEKIIDTELELYNLKSEVTKILFDMENIKGAIILHMKYIEFKDLKGISKELKTSYGYVKKLLSEGIEEFYRLYYLKHQS